MPFHALVAEEESSNTSGAQSRLAIHSLPSNIGTSTTGGRHVRLVPLTAAVALLSLAPATPAASQQLSAVRAGQRVRITTTKLDRLIGTLRAIAGDTLVVSVPAERGAGVVELTVPPTQVGALEVSLTGPRRSRALQGLVLGLAAGAALGYMLTADMSCSGCEAADRAWPLLTGLMVSCCLP